MSNVLPSKFRNSLVLHLGKKRSNGRWIDQSTKGNHGVVTGATRDEFGFWFDGSDDRVTAPISMAAYPFSMGVWVKTSDANGACVVLADASAVQVYYGIDIIGGVIRISARNTDFKSSNGTSAVNDGTWKFVGASYISNTSRKLYVDGVFDVENTDNVPWNVLTDVLDVARFGDNSPSAYMAGQAGMAFLMNRALSANEWEELYNITKHRYL